jgi:hypothetical protein
MNVDLKKNPILGFILMLKANVRGRELGKILQLSQGKQGMVVLHECGSCGHLDRIIVGVQGINMGIAAVNDDGVVKEPMTKSVAPAGFKPKELGV